MNCTHKLSDIWHNITLQYWGSYPERLDVVYAQARVYCGNTTQQIGLNHDYHIRFEC